jgi:predicted nucleotidyltransferase
MEPGLEGLSGELRQAIERAAAALKAAGACEVYLFGSAAKGRMREGSDIDLAVAGLPPEVFFHAMAEAHDPLGSRDLDLIELDDDNDFVRYLSEHGELVRVG